MSLRPTEPGGQQWGGLVGFRPVIPGSHVEGRPVSS